LSCVVLKPGKERIFKQRHHWIFSGAIATYPGGYRDGELAPISSHTGEMLGWGFFNRKCSLAGRIVSFGKENVFEALTQTLERAVRLRSTFFYQTHTTAYRLVNGEGDGLPGLIIDRYGPYLVFQIGALGMRHLLPFFIEKLVKKMQVEGIYEKSIGSSLKEECLKPREEVLWGNVPDFVTIKEEGIQFEVALKSGQKTGFFLDQREMRKWIAELAKGKKVLNGCCYTGGFTLAALKGGAAQVDSVDVSASAIELCKKNVFLNGHADAHANFFQEDIFDFINSKGCDYELVILDPPAFAKKKKDIPAAMKGYKRLFGSAIQRMPECALLLASSCSYYMNEPLFERILNECTISIQRPARVLGRHRHALDHPINPFHPESSYLKSLVLMI
jgi:23S rRNA (cytosine1962-C5)-methyltransferase